MSEKAEARKGISRYPLRFGAMAFLIIAVTLVLVLFVIPERYVLSPGFRESGESFPTPRTPFVPVAMVPVPPRARPLPPAPEVEPVAGPTEAFWDEVLPLLESDRPGAALLVFERYLDTHPDDVDVRRELAVTLLGLGRTDEALPILRSLLETTPDAELELLLARALRDSGRLAEASRAYAALAERRPGDDALALEWARAHAWAGDHARAAEILTAALARHPESTPLRMELVRAHYALGHLRQAVDVLAGLERSEVLRPEDEALADDVVRALIPGVLRTVVSAPRPATLIELAMEARYGGDADRARTLLEEALEARPGDRTLWLSLADLLEYELQDLEGARDALLEAERLAPLDSELELRLARLDAWTGRSDPAERRLADLLAEPDEGETEFPGTIRSDALVLAGDLRRWAGARGQAAGYYERALAVDPNDSRARAGLEALEDEVEQQVTQLEEPGVTGNAYSLADTDDFLRVDAGGGWAQVADGRWVVEGAAGQRWLEGYDLAGAEGRLQGAFFDLGLARWWGWGTLRTGLSLGAQHVRSEWDVSLGASLRHRGASGADTEVRFERGPSYPLTSTLQSALAEVVQERLSLTHARSLTDRWSLFATLDAARLRVAADALPVDPQPVERLQLGVSAGRRVGGSLTLGLATSGVAFTDAAPMTVDTGAGSRPLFWDPEWSVSAGPYVALDHELGHGWSLVGRLEPGVVLLRERRLAASEPRLLLQASADAGVRLRTGAWSTTLRLFHYQGRLDGYRAYGARLSFGARSPSLGGGQ